MVQAAQQPALSATAGVVSVIDVEGSVVAEPSAGNENESWDSFVRDVRAAHAAAAAAEVEIEMDGENEIEGELVPLDTRALLGRTRATHRDFGATPVLVQQEGGEPQIHLRSRASWRGGGGGGRGAGAGAAACAAVDGGAGFLQGEGGGGEAIDACIVHTRDA